MKYFPKKLTMTWIRNSYKEGSLTPEELAGEIVRRAEKYRDYNIWIVAAVVEVDSETNCKAKQPGAANKSGILSMVQGSDGARGEVLRCDNRPVNNPFAVNDTKLSYVSMNGQEVYKFAVKTVPKVIEEAVKKAGLEVEDIDLFVLHQANLRIIESVAKRLHQPMEKFPTNLEECGNISAASVPILLDNINKHGMICEGKKIVLAGFGAGLTWGATVLVW